jgi:nucleotide-binding universal stress UspA family protein
MSFIPGYSLLIPTDFTEKSNLAFSFAADLVKQRGGIIHALHVVEFYPELNALVIEEARLKLADYVREQQLKLDVTIIPNIVTGNIFNSIGEAASRLGANLIVMGVHGMHGIQFVMGSFAARIILGCSIPVILISEEVKFRGFNNIVLPLDMTRKVDKIVSRAIELGMQYGSTIHVFSSIDVSSVFKKQILIAETRKILNSIKRTGLNATNKLIYNANSHFVDNVLEHSKEINADLIMMTLQAHGHSLEFVVGKTEHQIMENARMPLYLINPVKEFRSLNLFSDAYSWHKK